MRPVDRPNITGSQARADRADWARASAQGEADADRTRTLARQAVDLQGGPRQPQPCPRGKGGSKFSNLNWPRPFLKLECKQTWEVGKSTTETGFSGSQAPSHGCPGAATGSHDRLRGRNLRTPESAATLHPESCQCRQRRLYALSLVWLFHA